jgi:hypothetical protein
MGNAYISISESDELRDVGIDGDNIKMGMKK